MKTKKGRVIKKSEVLKRLRKPVPRPTVAHKVKKKALIEDAKKEVDKELLDLDLNIAKEGKE